MKAQLRDGFVGGGMNRNASSDEMDNSRESSQDFDPPQRKRTRTPPVQISPLLINHVSKLEYWKQLNVKWGKVRHGERFFSNSFLNQVLEQIFAAVSVSDLSNFRMVCGEWNAVATKCLQSKLGFITIGCRNANHSHSLHYHHQLVNSSFTHTASSSPHPLPRGSTSSPTRDAASSGAPLVSSLVTPTMNADQLNKFLQVISHSTNPPFIKFEIVSSFFIPGNQLVLHRLFQLVSPFIQVLKISLDNRAPGEFTPQFLTPISFPKLKSVIFEILRQFTLAEPGTPEVANTVELRDNAVSYRILSAISFSSSNLESLEVSLQRKCDGEGQQEYNLDGTPNFERDRRAGLGGGGNCPCQHFSSLSPNDTPTPPPPNDTADNFKFETNMSKSINLNSNGLGSDNDSNPDSIMNPLGVVSIPSSSSSLKSWDVGAGPSSSSTSSASPSVKCHLPLPINTGYQSTPPRISNSPKLKRLHLRLRNSFIHQTCITSLLERLAGTLEELCFTEEGHGSRVVVEFPKMTRLSNLTISSICEFEQNFVTILPFSYSEQLPGLKELNLWDCFGTERRYEQLFLSTTPSHTMTKLVLPSQFKNVQLAQNMPRVFPRLKSLTLVFSTRPDNLAVIEAVFQACGESLEELHLITDMDIQNQNVDHVLTGLPKEICRKMRVDESFVLPLYFQGMVTRKASLVSLKSKGNLETIKKYTFIKNSKTN